MLNLLSRKVTDEEWPIAGQVYRQLVTTFSIFVVWKSGVSGMQKSNYLPGMFHSLLMKVSICMPALVFPRVFQGNHKNVFPELENKFFNDFTLCVVGLI